ncbi:MULTISPECIES: TetR/AcrR family transcriptional regulator [unclassified Sphingobium]|uniref:TetR/AcrR family transcriptional regulator n=1 Tax=unclassified Sphingobium TaxID=2611147 RepID=UPI00222470C6|nr:MULTISPECIES: TetR/AcrR family transcriptional regulator [unclassified Sphingobium]MCW2413331.1 AcrR family transcriptional regulator [Sphingobium sp. B8D3D]MCW2414370.1 AcrR family transcriptional regulator [Sphingobium sp. B8D3A]
MGRRSDHGREELEALILEAAQGLMEETGYSRFSAREVAKRIGYSVGTIMHVFGNVDGLVLAVNSRTFARWAQWLEDRLQQVSGTARIQCLVQGYFDFAGAHPNLWSAIYEHRLPEGMDMPDALAAERARLTTIIVREVEAVLPSEAKNSASRLARSLIATVHGHCSFALGGSFALMEETDPLSLAEARVMEALRANGASL